MNLDRCVIAGRVTQPVRMRKTHHDNVDVCTIPIAVNRRYRDSSGEMQTKTVFLDVQAYAAAALLAHDRLSVGDEILIEGRHQNRTVRDAETGKTVNTLDVVAEQLHFSTKGGTDV